MLIAVLKEAKPDETRVALTPDAVKTLTGKGYEVAVESGAGVQSGASDADYRAVGASISINRTQLLASAEVFPWSTLRPPRTRKDSRAAV